MSKYTTKANELLARTRSLLDSFELVYESKTPGVSNEYYAPREILEQYPELLLDVQTLFFSGSPQNPLYVKAMSLNKRVEMVLNDPGNRHFGYSDFKATETLLLRYSQYRHFFEAQD